MLRRLGSPRTRTDAGDGDRNDATKIFDDGEPPPRFPPRCCFTIFTATPNSPKLREISDYAPPSQTTVRKTSETVHFSQISL